jgi:transposase
MDLNEPLYKCYLLKEQLRGILQHPWRYLGALRRRLEEWIETVKDTLIYEMITVAKRLERHIDSVVAGSRFGLKMGLVESINSKIAALRVQARGYRDPEYFKLKIFQRCGLPENPWARVIL